MNYKKYTYSQFSVQKEDMLFSLKVNDYKTTRPEQFNIFSLMINFGYIPVDSGELFFTDRQIVDFWNYGKNSVLKNIELNQYYENFGIAPTFTTKVPTVKTSGAFFSEQYNTRVVWINDTSVGKIASSPQSYRRDGLELFGTDDEIKGSILPEYFHLYEIVDEANSNWPKLTKTEKYSFLVELKSISGKTKFCLPKELSSTLSDLQA